jgi:pimeloyl-ACP methyl ester carboxylesterase
VRFALACPERVERLVLVAPLPARRRPHWDALESRLRARADAPELGRIERLRAAGVEPREAAYHAAWLDAYLTAYGNTRTALESRPFVPPNDDPDAAAALGQALLA